MNYLKANLPRAGNLPLGASPSRRPWAVGLVALLAVCLWASSVVAQAPGAAAAESPVEVESYLTYVIRSSGWIGGVILLCSIYFISTVTRLFFEMRPVVAAPPALTESIGDMLKNRQFREIFAAVQEDPSFLARLLKTGIAELPNGLAEARDAMERVGEAVTVEMDKKISMMAVLGTLGPMIGLLGTLKGMIAAFSVIARTDTQMRTQEVANAISEALLLTFEGVALAIPAIYFFAIFRSRVAQLSVNTVLQADEFLRHFAHAARSKAPAAKSTPDASA